MQLKTVLLSIIMTLNLSALSVGEVPKNVVITGDNGGLISGETWNSSTIKDKVYVLFYVDPDEKGVNEHYSKALQAKKYREKGAFGSMAIINLAATWKPNFVIEKILASKQEEFPQTIYVKDKASVLVKEWEVVDDASNILIFDKSGKLLFYKSGKMQEDDMKKSFEIIEANL